jgi:acyl-CoA synthetase (AMP-forming)/AMP-acid ligase II
MVRRFGGGEFWQNRTIAHHLDDLVAKRPEQLLVIEAGGTHTAAKVHTDARKLAGNLARRGLQRGQVVSFQLPNWYEAVLIELACVYGGFVCNPIVTIYRDAEVDFIIKDSGSAFFFVPEQFRNFSYREMVQRLQPGWGKTEVVTVRGNVSDANSFDQLMHGEPAQIGVLPDPNHIKLIMYTSGTTSRAKGVLHTHNSIAMEITNFSRWLKLDGNDVVLMPSPLGHITGYLYGIQLPVTLGIPVVLMEAWDVAAAVGVIEQHGVTFTIGATPFLQELSNFCLKSKKRLPSLRYFPTGGAPVPPEVVLTADRAFDRCIAFRLYGSTEAPTVTLGITDPKLQDLRANTEGYVVGHEIKLVDANDKRVSLGDEGEILTRGPEMFAGYALAEQNDGLFDSEGYFRTGDLAVESPENCLTITGRKKDIIIRGGENLSPKEIEDVLYTHPAVKEAAVVAMPHARLGETCCAFVTLKPSAGFDFEAMLGILSNSGLAKQKFPERLEIVDNLPYTAAGKIRKNVLREEIARKIKQERD